MSWRRHIWLDTRFFYLTEENSTTEGNSAENFMGQLNTAHNTRFRYKKCVHSAFSNVNVKNLALYKQYGIYYPMDLSRRTIHYRDF